MAASSFDDRYVTLRNRPIVPAPAYLLLLDLEARGFSITAEGSTTIVVHPPARLTRQDCADIRRKAHLLTLLDYCTRPDLDAHLFRDDGPAAPGSGAGSPARVGAPADDDWEDLL